MKDIQTRISEQMSDLRKHHIEPKYISLSHDAAETYVGNLWEFNQIKKGTVPDKIASIPLIFNQMQNRDVVVLTSPKKEFQYHDKLDEIRNNGMKQ